MYYTTIPLVSERPHNRRWDASKLRELRKRMDSNTIADEEIEQVAADFLDGEIVDLASDWLGNTVSFYNHISDSIVKCGVGRPKAFREMCLFCSHGYARPYHSSSGDDWHSQERHLGCAENYRMCANPGGD